MSIAQPLTDKWQIVSIVGDFDAQTAKTLRPQLETIADSDHGDLMIDLSAVEFIDSSGIGALVFLFKRLQAKERKMCLNGLSGQPFEVLSSLGIDKVIPCISEIDVENTEAKATGKTTGNTGP